LSGSLVYTQCKECNDIVWHPIPDGEEANIPLVDLAKEKCPNRCPRGSLFEVMVEQRLDPDKKIPWFDVPEKAEEILMSNANTYREQILMDYLNQAGSRIEQLEKQRDHAFKNATLDVNELRARHMEKFDDLITMFKEMKESI